MHDAFLKQINLSICLVQKVTHFDEFVLWSFLLHFGVLDLLSLAGEFFKLLGGISQCLVKNATDASGAVGTGGTGVSFL